MRTSKLFDAKKLKYFLNYGVTDGQKRREVEAMWTFSGQKEGSIFCNFVWRFLRTTPNVFQYHIFKQLISCLTHFTNK